MPMPCLRLQLDKDQLLPHSEFMQLFWADPATYRTTDRENCPPEVFDPYGLLDPDDRRFLVIKQEGIYRLWVSGKFGDKDPNGKTRRSGRRAVAVQMNDGNRDILASGPADPGGTTTVFGGIDLPLVRGDRLSIWVEQQSKGAIAMVGSSAKDTALGLSWEGVLAGITPP